jgi:hypothetical protein
MICANKCLLGSMITEDFFMNSSSAPLKVTAIPKETPIKLQILEDVLPDSYAATSGAQYLALSPFTMLAVVLPSASVK